MWHPYLLYNARSTISAVTVGSTIYGWKLNEESDLYSVIRSWLSKGCIMILWPSFNPGNIIYIEIALYIYPSLIKHRYQI